MLEHSVHDNLNFLPLYIQHFRLPEAERRGYKNVFDALIRITKEEGVLTLWRVSI